MSTTLITAELEPVADDLALPAPCAVQHQEALEFLQELASEAIVRHDVLKREASGKILDVCENLVRCGWYLNDARQFLIEDGQYIVWVEQAFPTISYGYACRLRKLANHFCRDAIDADQRKRLDIRIDGLLEIGDHLRRQIAATQAASISDLYRFAGLLPPPGTRAHSTGSKGAHPRGLKTTLNDLDGYVRTLDVVKLSGPEREELCNRLAPAARLFERLSPAPAGSSSHNGKSAHVARVSAGSDSLEDLEQALNATASALVQVDHRTLTLDECARLMNHLSPFAEFHRSLLVRILG